MAKSKAKKAKPSKVEVKFVFDNVKAAKHFVSWLCESGEQDYWNYMEYREEEEKGNITVIDFDYWQKKTANGDVVVPTRSGRLAEE